MCTECAYVYVRVCVQDGDIIMHVRLCAFVCRSSVFEMKDVYGMFTMDTIASIAFGVSSDTLNNTEVSVFVYVCLCLFRCVLFFYICMYVCVCVCVFLSVFVVCVYL